MFTNTIAWALGCYPWKQLYLIAFVDLVRNSKDQSYPVKYYLESVEEYSEGKIPKSEPEPGRKIYLARNLKADVNFFFYISTHHNLHITTYSKTYCMLLTEKKDLN